MPAIGMTGSRGRGLAGRARLGGGGGWTSGGGGGGRREAIALQRTSGVCTQAPCERSLVKEWQRPPGAPGNPAPHLRRFAATRSARPTEEPAPRVPGAVGGAWESDVHLEVRQLPGAKAAGLERGGLA